VARPQILLGKSIGDTDLATAIWRISHADRSGFRLRRWASARAPRLERILAGRRANKG
jgi:hypothetical protein